MSFTYTVEHTRGGKTFERPSTFVNPHLNPSAITYTIDLEAERFLRALPDTNVTPLHSLPAVAQELGFARVFVKDESLRFGLPSFKPTGASWAVYKVLCQKAALPTDTSIQQLRDALSRKTDVRLVTCTAGNWGRAVSRIATLLGVKATVYVPGVTPEYTRNLISQDGGIVKHIPGALYDEVLAMTAAEARDTDAILVVDVDVEGCGDVPQWVSDGYHTILQETDRQVAELTNGRAPDLVTCSVGAGSWAQAVAAHYKTVSHSATVVAVEPDQAASIKEALHRDSIVSIRTGNTIMNGMNCGTVSAFSWPVLRNGIDISTVVTDREAHKCVVELQSAGINAGPCGAANLAALRRVCQEVDIPNKKELNVVLFSSEGNREYEVPVCG